MDPPTSVSPVLYEIFLDERRITVDFRNANRNTALPIAPLLSEDRCIQLLLARDDMKIERLDWEGLFGKRIGASMFS